MATKTSHNKKSSAVKRILSEARELRDPTPEFAAWPLDDNIFEWHFTLRGPSASEFEHGYYHGRVILPAEYPFRPPDVMILTPNGRWELNKKICLTFTGFHEEMWQPAWGIRTALIGVQAFMAARAEAAVGIGSLDYPTEERERLALLSCDWTCPVCQKPNIQTLPSTSSGQVRIQQSLPDGLTIDTTARPQKPVEAPATGSNASADPNAVIAEVATNEVAAAMGSNLDDQSEKKEQQQQQQQQQKLSQDSVNAETGGTMQSLLSADANTISLASSRSLTPGQVTPLPPPTVATERSVIGSGCENAKSPSALDKGKGKERDFEQDYQALSKENAEQEQATIPAANSVRASSTASLAWSVARPSEQEQQQPRMPRQSSFYRSLHPPLRQQQAHARHPSSAEASAQRLAALDRAIATVICLLAALVIRRVLNAWN